MLEDKLIHLEVNNQANLRNVFSEIRADIDTANSRFTLDGIYYRAGYVVVLVNDAFGDIDMIRSIAETEFRETARRINRHAEKIGMAGNYDEVWVD